MSIGGCEVSYRFLDKKHFGLCNSPFAEVFLVIIMKEKTTNSILEETQAEETPILDLTDTEDVRKAIIASEILNRKY